jgi:membrane-associated protein
MNYRTFVTYNIVGGLLWGVGVTSLGYFLGQIEFVKNNIEPVLLVIVFVSFIPVVLELLKARKARPDEPIEPFETPVIEDTDPIKVDLDTR